MLEIYVVVKYFSNGISFFKNLMLTNLKDVLLGWYSQYRGKNQYITFSVFTNKNSQKVIKKYYFMMFYLK